MPAAPLNESSARLGLWEELPVTKEATTSRVVINNELLRVVMFAMDAEQELTDHSSARAVTVHMLEGEMRFTVGGTQHAMKTGDVIYLAPGERHAVIADTPCRFALVMVDVERAGR